MGPGILASVWSCAAMVHFIWPDWPNLYWWVIPFLASAVVLSVLIGFFVAAVIDNLLGNIGDRK